jgi:hypothetical protein
MICGLFFLVFLYSSCFSNGCHEGAENNRDKSASATTAAITWEKSVSEKGRTIIPGSLQADFGRFEFRWIITAEGKTKLVFLEPVGSAELTPIEKNILLLADETGNTLLFQEWFPLSDSKEPASLNLIAAVSTKELFSVLTPEKQPPTAPIIKHTAHISWGDTYRNKGATYLRGTVPVSFGTLNILWKKKAQSIPLLITEETPAAGELPPSEAPLAFWTDKTAGISLICQERHPQLNQKFIRHLWPLAKVKTEELLEGLRRLAH